MSYNCVTLTACPNIQTMLDNQFGASYGSYRDGNPFLETMLSPVNRDGVLQKQIDTGNGHVRTVQMLYSPRKLESVVSDTAIQSCTGGVEPCDTYTNYDIDTRVGASVEWSITLSNLEDICRGDGAVFSQEFQSYLDVMARKIDDDLVIQSAALPGNFATTPGLATPIAVQTKLAAACCNAYETDLVERVTWEFMQNEWNGPIFLWGGNREYWDYWRALDIACCNEQGLDLSKLMSSNNKILPFFDRRFAANLTNANGFLAFIPKAIQLLTYNEFVGERGLRVIDTETYKQGVIQDPVTGLILDYVASFDCGKWNFQLKLAYELVAAPDDMFFALDRLSGVNYINEFNIVNPA